MGALEKRKTELLFNSTKERNESKEGAGRDLEFTTLFYKRLLIII